jgi:CBS-domain-containing membrane protein
MALFTEKGITAAPVIDEAGHPVGVVSRSDLLVHQCESCKHRDDSAPTAAEGTIADLMTPAVFGVSPDTPAHRVVSEMVGLKVHRLFVVDAAGALVGVISAMDVLKHLKAEE